MPRRERAERTTSRAVDLLRRAAWAPIAAVLIQQGTLWFGVRRDADALVHFCGGAAAAFFLLRASQIFAERLGITRRGTHGLVAFAGACTAAVVCEIVEFASDQWLGSHAQESLHETMLDLVFGVTGAAIALVVVMTLDSRRRGRGVA